MDLHEAEAYFISVLAPLCEPLHGKIETADGLAGVHLEEHRFKRQHGRHRTDLLRIHLERLIETEPIVGFSYNFDPKGRILLVADDGLRVLLLHTNGPVVPGAGRNRARRSYWANAAQGRLLEDYNLSRLLATFCVRNGEAEILIARPLTSWPYRGKVNTDVQFTLPRTSAGLQELRFDPADDQMDLDLGDLVQVEEDDDEGVE